MDREHLIIIALILVALYMMNKDTNTDTVKAMGPVVGPMGRIRYGTCSDGSEPPCVTPFGHIRTRREGFMPTEEDPFKASGSQPNRVRFSDKSFAHSQHIKNHIRSRNMNSMFSGMMEGCGTKPKEGEGFRFIVDDPANCVNGICG
jgi:hypothetical protein